MNKFDTSCGLTELEIGIVRYNIKKDLLKHLPVLPESVDMNLFFEGRDAWTYRWELRERGRGAPLASLYVGVMMKLKKEFHYLEMPRLYKFLCIVQKGLSIYDPIISIHPENG